MTEVSQDNEALGEISNSLEGEIKPDEGTNKIIKNLDELCERLRNGNTSNRTIALIQKLQQVLGENELLSNEKVRKAIQDYLSDYIRHDHYLPVDEAEKLIQFLKNQSKNFNESDFLPDKDEMLHLARGGLFYNLTIGSLTTAEKHIQFLKDHYKDFDENDLFSDKKVSQAARDLLSRDLKDGSMANAKVVIQFLKDHYENYNEIVTQATQDWLSERIKSFYFSNRVIKIEFENIKGLCENFNENDLFSDGKLLQAIQNEVIYCLQCGMMNKWKPLIRFLRHNYKDFNESDFISDKNVLQSAQDGLIYCFEHGDTEDAEMLIQFLCKYNENFNVNDLISDKKVLLAVETGRAYCLENGYSVEKLDQLLEDYNTNLD